MLETGVLPDVFCRICIHACMYFDGSVWSHDCSCLLGVIYR